MQLSKKHIFLSMLLIPSFLMQAEQVIVEQNQEIAKYELSRIDLNSVQFQACKDQCASAYDTAHHMKYAAIPAALVAGYLVYDKWGAIKSVAQSGANAVVDMGKYTFNGVATVSNAVASPFTNSRIGYFEPAPADVVAAQVLSDPEIIALKGMLKNAGFWAFCGTIAKSTATDLATRGVIFVYRHAFDGGAQNIKLFVENETSLAETRFYLRDWLQDMQTVLTESSIESLYDTLYEFDKQVIADAERIAAFMSSLKEYNNMQADIVDRKVKMLVDETNAFAAVAEQMLNEQQTQQENNRQYALGVLMNRTLKFINLINREVDSFVKVTRPAAQKQ